MDGASAQPDMVDGLRALPVRTLAKRLQPMLPAIDQRIREGVEHTTIVEYLQSEGVAVKLETFRKILYRYRRARRDLVGGAHAPSETQARMRTDALTSSSTAAEASRPAAQLKTPRATSVAQALDPVHRESFANQFMDVRRPLLSSVRKKLGYDDEP